VAFPLCCQISLLTGGAQSRRRAEEATDRQRTEEQVQRARQALHSRTWETRVEIHTELGAQLSHISKSIERYTTPPDERPGPAGAVGRLDQAGMSPLGTRGRMGAVAGSPSMAQQVWWCCGEHWKPALICPSNGPIREGHEPASRLARGT